MSFEVHFTDGSQRVFEGDVHQLNASRRTGIGAGMVELKVAQQAKSWFVNIDHIAWARDL